MSADVECECEEVECETGAPAWVVTFADLMALLMCFFVLLLSFSEMDVIKFKRIAGSMSDAFGVQRQVEANEIPMGTSIIAQEFSPGKTEPTPVDEVRQQTTREEINLETAKEILEQVAEAQAEALRVQMKEEIEEGLIEIDSQREMIVIRIKEKGSFPSGSADLREEFLPTLARIREQIIAIPGTITVAGHTDDIPINTYRFRSNWELSSSRAVSVLEQLLKTPAIKPEDTEVKGLADTQPLVANDSYENRATNRRVEILILPSSDTVPPAITTGEGQPAASLPGINAVTAVQDDAERPVLDPALTRELGDLFENQPQP